MSTGSDDSRSKVDDGCKSGSCSVRSEKAGSWCWRAWKRASRTLEGYRVEVDGFRVGEWTSEDACGDEWESWVEIR